jgi:gas vesicle protein
VARRDRNIVFVERESSSPLWWLVVGGALGAGLALLFAPESGSSTRRVLARRLARLRSTAKDVIGEFREGLESDEDEVEAGLEEGEDADSEEAEDEEAEDEADEEAEEITPLSARDELEKRLAAARARRQRTLADEEEEPVA